MASEPPRAAKHPRPWASTTIKDIGDDLLLEIFLHLPSLPSLVRAALACPTFLHAVRSSPVFRCRFQALHPPQLLGFFHEPCRPSIPPFFPLRGRSDPDHTAVIRGADFFLTRLTEDSAHEPHGWDIQSCHRGYVVLVNLSTDQIAAYNPLTQALHDVGVYRAVCVEHMKRPTCIAVFSSATMEWTPAPQPEFDAEFDAGRLESVFDAGRQVNGFVYWKHLCEDYALTLNTTTLQISRLDLLVGDKGSKLSALGHTKDGELCMVCADDSDANIGRLFVWFWRADDDGVEKWTLKNAFKLSTLVDEYDTTVHVEAVIDGFVYLSTKYLERCESLLSLCLETEELDILIYDTYQKPAHHYIMGWPLSLVCDKCQYIPRFCVFLLEWWSFEILVLLSGLLLNTQIETSALSVWWPTYVGIWALAAADGYQLHCVLMSPFLRCVQTAANTIAALGGTVESSTDVPVDVKVLPRCTSPVKMKRNFHLFEQILIRITAAII
ncbi:uncharacterized protein LOC124657632 [Lolium rigidum]|uniref:uncharacterized protein LOC124657632 n=1 Tax=Lolium rigidum TaxID=89674 RepID=UPI001F5D2911|nr:uncharacterized protein LOC124657632 [Lolium rigidum]